MITMLLLYSASIFASVGNKMMRWRTSSSSSGNNATTNWRFKAAFGISPLMCRQLWELIGQIADQSLSSNARPKHLLWALMFLRQYNTTEINCAMSGADEKTFRKWSWTFIHLISKLDLVSNTTIFIFI